MFRKTAERVERVEFLMVHAISSVSFPRRLIRTSKTFSNQQYYTENKKNTNKATEHVFKTTDPHGIHSIAKYCR